MQSRGFFFTWHDIYLCVVNLFVSALQNYIARGEIQPGGRFQGQKALDFSDGQSFMN